MTQFTFIHAADLHLDSPLLGLAGKSTAFAARVEQASRQAFDNLITLAIDEQARFMVLAGDVFDGELRNYQTGLLFTAGMRRLQDAGVQVFLIAGNHDAENRYAPRMRHSDNVHLFAHKSAESAAIEDLGVVVHGRSFGQREVIDNIARDYPAAVANRFNIGVLHTACQGSEGDHAAYAPCTAEQLVNHGYDYWALGHIHARAVLNEHPHIVYPGNLQGRSPRETGPKGATVVRVGDGRVVACDHRDLDVVRWASAGVDVGEAASRSELLDAVARTVTPLLAELGDRPMALRLRLEGPTPLHGAFLLDRDSLREDVESLLASLPAEIWLEKLELRTASPALALSLDPTVAGQLGAELTALGAAAPTLLEACLAEIQAKMPASARMSQLFDQLRAEAPARAIEIARTLVSEAGADRASG